MSSLVKRAPYDDFTAALSSSAYFGGGTGILGAAYGAGHATLHGRAAILWSAAAGVQCFVLGSTFYFARTALQAYNSPHEPPTYRDELIYSALAGSVAGIAGGALRGRQNIVPGAVMIGLLGVGGQTAFSALVAVSESSRHSRPLLDRLSDSKWWPLKSIPDEQYAKELAERVISLEAEIAIIDEKIAALKQDPTTMQKT